VQPLAARWPVSTPDHRRKGFQAATRADLPRFELDKSDAAGRLKVNPLIDWDAPHRRCLRRYDLPAHPLVAQGYPSIGCAPCTSKVAPGEDPVPAAGAGGTRPNAASMWRGRG
jgi:phosphoadenosine phosphosulfate reductase